MTSAPNTSTAGVVARSARFAAWFAMRPQLYPELARRAARRVSGGRSPKNGTGVEAARWCNERAISVDEALRELGIKTPATPLPDQFQSEFDFANEAAKNCPVEMGGPGILSLLYHACEATEATTVLETGVAYGWSSLAILLSINGRPESRLTSIDMPYPGLGNDRHVGCVVPSHLSDSWKLIRLPDRDAIPRVLASNSSFDLCHYDSDKSYEGRCWSYPRLWNSLRPGGLFLSDDAGDNIAFREFAEAHSEETTFIVKDNSQYVGLIKKSKAA